MTAAESSPSSATEVAVRTQSLRKVYQPRSGKGSPVIALEDLSLDIAAGETFGLIGPNGAGKSTLMRILATLMEPTFGWAHVAGYDCELERLEVCKRVGFMPELFYLYEEFRVWEYLEFFAGAYGVAPAEQRKTIDAVIELTDLGVRRDSFTGELSKGMRQRLLLAKTLVHDPDVLILDEPTSGMDPQARIEFRNVIRTLHKMGKTIIISSHILSDLSEFCTSIAILEQGRLRASGSIAELQDALEIRAEVELECLADGADPLDVLREIEDVAQPRRFGDKVLFGYDGQEAKRADILAALVRAGVRVTDFREKSNDLEEIFLQVGATKVQ